MIYGYIFPSEKRNRYESLALPQRVPKNLVRCVVCAGVGSRKEFAELCDGFNFLGTCIACRAKALRELRAKYSDFEL